MAHAPLNVEYHQQDSDKYCGPACLQMILHSLGMGWNQKNTGANGALDQNYLYTKNINSSRDKTVGWGMAPDEACDTLNDLAPKGHKDFDFRAFGNGNKEAISRLAVWTIFKGRAAPMVLVCGGHHWVLVVDYDTTAEPASWDDDQYDIVGLTLQEPAPALAGDKPPPHDTNDGCGTGSRKAKGDVLMYVTLQKWYSEYLTRVAEGLWKSDYVAVCELDPADNVPNAISFAQSLRRADKLNMELIDIVQPWPPDLPLEEVSTEFAMAAAKEGLEKYGLYDKEPWSDLLKNTEPGVPVKVSRLDYPGMSYYIVPMVATDGPGAPVATIVNAHSGLFEQAAAVPEHSMVVLPDIEDPEPVWQPSTQSFSPFYPFEHSIVPGRPSLHLPGRPGEAFETPDTSTFGG